MTTREVSSVYALVLYICTRDNQKTIVLTKLIVSTRINGMVAQHTIGEATEANINISKHEEEEGNVDNAPIGAEAAEIEEDHTEAFPQGEAVDRTKNSEPSLKI